MSRNQTSQPQRTQNNPLVLGTFSSTALRYLHGSLGPKHQVIGRADTRTQSNGGFGGGTYNHWFQINLARPGWIIVTKGPPRPKYIQVSTYELDKTPIQGESIFDADSVTTNGEVYIPYLNTMMSAQSDLYNSFSRLRLDRGDERYYPLGVGSYLLCVSTTRNEPLDYGIGVVIEFTTTEGFFELEDSDGSFVLQETDNTTESIVSPVTVNTTIPFPGAFTQSLCAINPGVTLTVADNATWLIGTAINTVDYDDYRFILEPGDDTYFDTIHDHSLSEWRRAWEESHQDTDVFPEIFVPLTNRS
jgi:hypothetical protein